MKSCDDSFLKKLKFSIYGYQGKSTIMGILHYVVRVNIWVHMSSLYEWLRK